MPQSDDKVTLSNTVLLLSPSPQIDGSEKRVVIQDSLNELLELVPAVPKLHLLNVLLKEHEWEEGHEEEDESFRERKRSTLEVAQVELQASEQAQALKDKHILTIDGEFPSNRLLSQCALRPLSPMYLHKILELLLIFLVSLPASQRSLRH
ncbi:hypothetical protein BGY98DRAFT_1100700 [Russula aff. rugulosa BPL654]|nr:hypothetical protein BGY98DRAFT_1100700 [Russula aff. rugulosa BPL654]